MRKAAGAGVGILILKDAASARTFAANEKPGIALVGVGGRGRWFAGLMPKLPVTIPAICEVDDARGAEGLSKLSEVPRFYDYRKMLDEKGKDIDGVIVSTPEFSRAAVMAACMKADKAVLGEKPLTRLPHESRVMRELARKHKVATQMGNQGTASGAFRSALSLIRGGVLGEIREIHVWNNGSKPKGDKPGGERGDRKPPRGRQPIPETLKWDLWLGPASQRNYHRDWFRGWRSWRDFGTSGLGWWGPHSANLGFMAMKVHELWDAEAVDSAKRTIRVVPKTPNIVTYGFPSWEIVRYEIPARGELPPLAFTWHRSAMHDIEKALGDLPHWRSQNPKPWWTHAGSAIVGSKAKIDTTSHCASFHIFPDELKKAEVPNVAPRSAGHEMEWVNAIKGGPAPLANFGYSGPLNEMLMLGNVATLVGKPFDFDPVTGKISDPDAEKALHMEYREGWSL